MYALHYDGAINKNSLGAVSEGAKLAAELGGEAHAILLGENVPQELAASLGKYGAKKVLVAEGPEGLAQPLVDAMAAAIWGGGYSYALFGGGLLGFEIGAGLAARLEAGVAMEVTAVRAENGELIAERPILGDSAISEIKYRSEVGIIIGRLNAFEINESGAGDAAVEQLSFELSPQAQQATMLTRGEQRGADVDIEGADILVAGGRGLGKAEGFQLAEDLAAAVRRQLRRRRDPRGRRRRLVPLRGADRPDRQDGRAEAVPRGGHLRRDPAQGRDAGLGEHRRDQQGRKRADLRILRPRDRRRSEQDPAEAHRGSEGQEGQLRNRFPPAPAGRMRERKGASSDVIS